jgi:hypothetical protein
MSDVMPAALIGNHHPEVARPPISGLPEIGTKCARVKIAKINRFAPSHDGGESEPLLAAVGIGSQSAMK